MRLIDADILSYALYDESPFHEAAWRYVKRGLAGELEMAVTTVTILETYNVLYWYYRVRPRKLLLRKLSLVVEGLRAVPASARGVEIALARNIPLGDGFLIATALDERLPVIVSNDRHIAKMAPKYGLIVENPLKMDRTASG